MTAQELWQDLSRKLQTTTEVVKSVGRINVGEKFSVRFTVKNQSDPPSSQTPHIRFTNLDLYVCRTDFARPLFPDGTPVDGLRVDLTPNTLDAGQSAAAEIEFLALRALTLQGIQQWIQQEDIAGVWVSGNLDLDLFFRVCAFSYAKAQINPAYIPYPIPASG